MWRAPGSGAEDGPAAARSLFAGRERPDGLFCITDLVACGLIDAVRQDLRIAAPQDLCVIGFDNIPASNWLGYGVTRSARLENICGRLKTWRRIATWYGRCPETGFSESAIALGIIF